MSGFNIVTGYTGVAHITPQQDRYINQSAFGKGTYVLPTGNQMECTISGATRITVSDGGVSLQGCVGIIDPGTVYNKDIDPGTTGMNRIDYLCVKYTKTSGSGVEALSFVVKTGTPVSGTPTPPSYLDGSIEGGDTEVEAPIWQINVSGLSISSVQRVAQVIPTQANLELLLSAYTDLLAGKAFVLDFSSGDAVNTSRTGLAIRDTFLFRGYGTYSQDVLGLASQVNAFGIGFKNSSTSMVLLSICGGKMYYCQYSNTGAGTVYNPLNLQSNIE